MDETTGTVAASPAVRAAQAEIWSIAAQAAQAFAAIAHDDATARSLDEYRAARSETDAAMRAASSGRSPW